MKRHYTTAGLNMFYILIRIHFPRVIIFRPYFYTIVGIIRSLFPLILNRFELGTVHVRYCATRFVFAIGSVIYSGWKVGVTAVFNIINKY